MITRSIRAKEIRKQWVLIDAEGLVLGRMASIVAKILRGKNKADYTPHMDHGDCVVIVNAEKVHLTGTKRETKPYYRHTGYPGGIKCRIAKEVLTGRFPQRVVEKSVERMLGSNGPMKRQRLRNLYVYAGPQHPHVAQQPKALCVADWNIKNHK